MIIAIKQLSLPLLLRIISAGSKFLVIFLLFRLWPEDEFKFYSFALAFQQVAVYVIGGDVYQLIHRWYAKSLNTKHFKTHLNYITVASYLIALLALLLLIINKIYYGRGIIIFLVCLFSSYCLLLFMEAYRYSGVLKQANLGELTLAIKSITSLMALLLAHLKFINSAEIFLIINALIDLIFAFYLKRKLFNAIAISSETKLYSMIRIYKNLKNLLFILWSSLMLRLYQNTDKIIAFLMFSSISAKYYFNAMIAFAIFNLLESAFNNQRVRSILSCNQNETRKTILDYLMIMLFALIVISLTAVIMNSRGFFANLGFDLWLFSMLLVSACLGSISNLFHQLIYARGEDKKLALISTIPVLIIINPFFLNLSAIDDSSLAGTVLLIHLCSLILKFYYYKTINHK